MNARLPGSEQWSFKRLLRTIFIAMVFALMALRVSAQNYSIDWYKIAGGGGTSSNGQYVVSSTIGQHDAGTVMTTGNYSLTGGFWTFGAVAVQTPGAPTLNILQTGPNTVQVWWLGAANSFKLQTNSTLSKNSWGTYGSTINSGGGTNSISISPPRGNEFFRLVSP
jgi:hypothetical protein